jgi:hypothetical protein
LFSVIEITAQTYPGDVVAVGRSNSNGNGDDIYLVQLAGGDPCSTITHVVIDDAGHDNEVGRCVRESGAMTTSGDVILTGYTEAAGNGDEDAFYLGFTISNQTVQLPRLYGDVVTGGGQNDRGYSLAVTTAAHGQQGVIISGETFANLCPTGNDPQDMLLVKTNGSANAFDFTDPGLNDCYAEWEPEVDDPNYAETCPTATLASVMDHRRRHATRAVRNGPVNTASLLRRIHLQARSALEGIVMQERSGTKLCGCIRIL